MSGYFLPGGMDLVWIYLLRRSTVLHTKMRGWSSPAYQRVRRVRFACSRRGAPGRLVLRLDATQDTHPADRRPPPLKCVPPLPVGARRDRPRWARGLRGMRAAGWDEDARADTQADEFSLFNPKAEKSYGRTGIEVAYLRVHELTHRLSAHSPYLKGGQGRPKKMLAAHYAQLLVLQPCAKPKGSMQEEQAVERRARQDGVEGHRFEHAKSCERAHAHPTPPGRLDDGVVGRPPMAEPPPW